MLFSEWLIKRLFFGLFLFRSLESDAHFRGFVSRFLGVSLFI